MVGGRRLLRADAARQLGEEVRDVTAAEVLANIDAMVWGIDAVEPGGAITLDTLLEVHQRLLSGTRLEEHVAMYALSRTGSAAAATIPARRRSFHPRLRASTSCLCNRANGLLHKGLIAQTLPWHPHQGLPQRRHGALTSSAHWYSLHATWTAPHSVQVPRA